MSRKRVVIFISGGGSNMEALIRAAQAADFPAEVVAVFSDKEEAGGLAKAKAAGIATQVFKRRTLPRRMSMKMPFWTRSPR